MFEVLLVLAIFAVPAAVLVAIVTLERKRRSQREKYGLGEIPSSEPVFDDTVATEGEFVLSKRTEIVESLLEVDRASSYGKTL